MPHAAGQRLFLRLHWRGDPAQPVRRASRHASPPSVASLLPLLRLVDSPWLLPQPLPQPYLASQRCPRPPPVPLAARCSAAPAGPCCSRRWLPPAPWSHSPSLHTPPPHTPPPHSHSSPTAPTRPVSIFACRSRQQRALGAAQRALEASLGSPTAFTSADQTGSGGHRHRPCRLSSDATCMMSVLRTRLRPLAPRTVIKTTGDGETLESGETLV